MFYFDLKGLPLFRSTRNNLRVGGVFVVKVIEIDDRLQLNVQVPSWCLIFEDENY